MSAILNRPKVGLIAAVLALPMATSLSAQEQGPAQADITVTGEIPDVSTLPDGPEIKGIISARKGDRMQVSTVDGQRSMIAIADTTQVKNAGLFGGGKADKTALLNGLPVTVKDTPMEWRARR